MYLRKLSYKEDTPEANYIKDVTQNTKQYLTVFLFGIIIILAVLLSSLSETEINIL